MVLEAINEPQTGPLLIGQDNKSCIQVVENPGRHHGRTKYLDVHLRWIEREYEREQLALVYVNTEFMVADVLTKSLAYERHARHTSAMKGHKMPDKEKNGAEEAPGRVCRDGPDGVVIVADDTTRRVRHGKQGTGPENRQGHL